METSPWKFGQKQFSIQKFTKSQFTNFKFKFKIKFVFVSSPSKSGSNDGVVWMEFNLYDYHGLESRYLAFFKKRHTFGCIKCSNWTSNLVWTLNHSVASLPTTDYLIQNFSHWGIIPIWIIFWKIRKRWSMCNHTHLKAQIKMCPCFLEENNKLSLNLSRIWGS